MVDLETWRRRIGRYTHRGGRVKSWDPYGGGRLRTWTEILFGALCLVAVTLAAYSYLEEESCASVKGLVRFGCVTDDGGWRRRRGLMCDEDLVSRVTVGGVWTVLSFSVWGVMASFKRLRLLLSKDIEANPGPAPEQEDVQRLEKGSRSGRELMAPTYRETAPENARETTLEKTRGQAAEGGARMAGTQMRGEGESESSTGRDRQGEETELLEGERRSLSESSQSLHTEGGGQAGGDEAGDTREVFGDEAGVKRQASNVTVKGGGEGEGGEGGEGEGWTVVKSKRAGRKKSGRKGGVVLTDSESDSASKKGKKKKNKKKKGKKGKNSVSDPSQSGVPRERVREGSEDESGGFKESA